MPRQPCSGAFSRFYSFPDRVTARRRGSSLFLLRHVYGPRATPLKSGDPTILLRDSKMARSGGFSTPRPDEGGRRSIFEEPTPGGGDLQPPHESGLSWKPRSINFGFLQRPEFVRCSDCICPTPCGILGPVNIFFPARETRVADGAARASRVASGARSIHSARRVQNVFQTTTGTE